MIADQEPGTVRVYTLGGFRVVVDAHELDEPEWVRKSARQLFKILLSSRQRRRARLELIGLLWPESAAEAGASNLRSTTHTLRKALERGPRAVQPVVFSDRDSLWLRRDPGLWVDADAFLEQLELAPHAADPLAPLEAADALYRGMYLPDDLYEDWAVSRREALRRAWIDLEFSLARERERRGQLDPAVLALNRLLEADPCDEHAAGELMLLLARAGRRAEAARAFQRLADALKSEIDSEPSEETTRIFRAVTTPEGHVERTQRRAGGPRHLPVHAGALLGREREVANLKAELLRPTVRLVTLVGPAGCGKTRLAVEVANELSAEFTGGICFVDLAPVRDSDLVIFAIGRALDIPQPMDGTPQLERVAQALSDSTTLLVLDNTEQVIEAGAQIAALVSACPGLKVLVTSREPLHLNLEHEFQVAPLPAPDLAGSPTMEALRESPAIKLFVQRAQAVRSGWTLDQRNARAVADLCLRLDCLPLAIELAAARVKLFAPQAILARMDRRLDLLTSTSRDVPERHQGLRVAFEWSYQLLSEQERRVFRRAGVFAGGLTANAAIALCADGDTENPPVLQTLEALADKSLVRVEPQSDGEPRFSMLETLREFALDELAESGEQTAQQLRHATWCLDLAEAADPELRGAHQILWLETLEREHDNMRAALEWALRQGGEPGVGARLAAALERFWEIRGYLQEGWLWLDLALRSTELPAADRARVCNEAGHLAFLRSEHARARELHAESLELSRAAGEDRGVIQSLVNLGLDAMAQDHDADATAALAEALSLAQASGDRASVAVCSNLLGRIAYGRGDLEGARTFFERSLALRREARDKWGTAQALSDLGDLLRAQGRESASLDAHRESLRIWQELADVWGLAYGLEGLAIVLLARSPDGVVRTLAAANAARERVGIRALPSRQHDVEEALQQCAAILGEDRFMEAWRLGGAMDLEPAVLEALTLGTRPSNMM